jgi:hypothetical protein
MRRRDVSVKIYRLANIDFFDSHKIWITLIAVFTVPCIFIVWILFQDKGLSIASGKEFSERFWLLFFTYPIVIGLIPYLVQVSGTDREQLLLRQRSKERIRILRRFSPYPCEALCGKSSIYNAIMSSLNRALRAVEKGEMLKARLLFCSPALDYPERVENRNYNEWGKEFADLLDRLIGNAPRAKIDITYLPKESGAGNHSLDDFLQALASYCESRRGNHKSFDEIYEGISESTKKIAEEINVKASNKKINLREDVHNIPFQIVLFESESCKEVTVTFAGHEILEDVKSGEPAGFFSSDPFVVEIFMQVYDEYVTTRRRRPFTPKHTVDVIKNQGDEKQEYSLENYLELGINVSVHPSVFSPLYGNSSKFTSWVLEKVLDKETSVLDIGSGTGVQALVAERVLRNNHAATQRKIHAVAIEAVQTAYLNLCENIDANKSSIQAERAALTAVTHNAVTNESRRILAYQLLTKDEKEQLRGIDYKDLHVLEPQETITGALIVEVGVNNRLIENGVSRFDNEKFEVIIADLPFVDARPSRNEERAFLDMAHREHETLFREIQKGRWLRSHGKIITSLSSLGGTNDVISFERLTAKFGLKVIQKFYFHEGDYMWIVYVLMRKDDVTDSYWLDCLHVEKSHTHAH